MDVVVHEFLNIPPVTRTYLVSCLAVTFLVEASGTLNIKIHKFIQIWRLFSSFLYFGSIDFSFVFNMLFLYRYCRWLEENWYRRKASEFLLMFLFCGVISIICATYFHLLFLGQILTMMIVYVWSRRNPLVMLEIFGLITVRAPYLPFVFFAFSFLLGSNATVDFIGIAIGHIYYFLEDIFPNQPHGFRVFVVPDRIKRLIDGNPDDSFYEPVPEAQPNDSGAGGFNWREE
ncbi:Derlin-2 [Cichlidogyrus casuarinus]|uniref:Derlin n=1 Tax=Cichlidogyrus casuarinus TaxID=1844966 RepID=A0ABD2PQT2_9PLAT